MTKDIEEVITEAQSTFDLKARLQGRGLRTGRITLYTDEVTGAELGSAYDVKNQLGLVIERKRSGIIGQIDALPEDSEDRKPLIKKRDTLIKKLDKTALVVSLRAVPPLIEKDCKRKSKRDLKLKGKIPDDMLTEYSERYVQHLLALTVTSVKDNETGAETTDFGVEDAKALQDYLPTQQFAKLDQKLAEIQFRDAVDETVTSDSDF